MTALGGGRSGERGPVARAAVTRKGETGEAEHEHSPGGGFGNRGGIVERQVPVAHARPIDVGIENAAPLAAAAPSKLTVERSSPFSGTGRISE